MYVVGGSRCNSGEKLELICNFCNYIHISLFAIKAATESRHTEQGTTAQTCKHKKEKKELQI